MSDAQPIERDARSFRRGDVVGGRYRLTGLLGRGGYGSVYAAEHTGTGQALALKMMGVDASSTNDDVVARFYREARITAGLTDVHTVRVFDVGQVDNGPLYMAMEMLRGPNLYVVLRRLEKASRRLSQHECIALALPILQSLAEAHAAGLVHRDLKPANIIIATMGDGHSVVKVLDFGIAHTQDSELTGEGQALGTPAYMSPEQVRGGHVDGRADLYSLGVILYRCLAGQLPFDADESFALAFMHVNEPLPPLRPACEATVSDAMIAVIERALAKDPADRYQSANEMMAALRDVAAQTPAPQVLKPVSEAGAALTPGPKSLLSALVAEVTDLKQTVPAVVDEAFQKSDGDATRAELSGGASAEQDAESTAAEPGGADAERHADAEPAEVAEAVAAADSPHAQSSETLDLGAAKSAGLMPEVGGGAAPTEGPAPGNAKLVIAGVAALVVALGGAFALLSAGRGDSAVATANGDGAARSKPAPERSQAAGGIPTRGEDAGGAAPVRPAPSAAQDDDARAAKLVAEAMANKDLAARERALLAATVLAPSNAAYQALLETTRALRAAAAKAEAAKAEAAKAEAAKAVAAKAEAAKALAAKAVATKAVAAKAAARKVPARRPTTRATAPPPKPRKTKGSAPKAAPPTRAKKAPPAKKPAVDAPYMDF